jgi:hypothetical protein
VNRLVRAALGATALVLLASPAYAATETVKDASGDVLVGSASEGEPGTRSPETKEGDIVRFTTAYSAKKLVLTLKLRAMPKTDYMSVFRVEVAKGKPFEILDGRSSGSSFTSIVRGLEGPVDCDGFSVKNTRAKAQVKVTVPRSCLGDSPWVRTGGAFATGLLSAEVSDQIAIDDARLDGKLPKRNLTVGPKVRVG